MSKDIKKALEHCVDWDCGNCPNRDELGSGETVCRGRLLPEVLGYVSDLETKLAEKERQLKLAEELLIKQEKEYDAQLEKQSKIHYRHLKEKKQDKISFAVEQLLDIKEEVFGTREMGIVFDIPPVQDAFNVIENKIKQLKREE